MNKKCVIFDMDGTLIDSMRYWRALGKEYLESKGVKGDLTKIIQQISGMTISEAAVFFSEKLLNGISADNIEQEINNMMEGHYRSDIPLKTGVKELLDKLCKSNVKMCVATATAEYLAETCLKRLGIYNYFDFVLSCETLNTHKREPYIYLEAAKRFNANPCDIAVYEDALYAAETAKAAGFYVVAVYDSEGDGEWLQLCALADEKSNIN